MKEVLTKSFWEGVRKTFNEALEGPPTKASGLDVPDEAGPNDASVPTTLATEHDVRPGPREAEIK